MNMMNVTGGGFGVAALVWVREAKVEAEETLVRGGEAVRGSARAAVIAHLREAERFEEDCERWDGMA